MTLTKAQEKVLDGLWAKAVKARAGNRCEYCLRSGEVWGLEAHHVIGRRVKPVRHVVSNGCSLCHAHHRFAEQNGVAFADWIKASRGMEWWNYLKAQSIGVKLYKDFTIIKKYLEGFL